MDLKAIEEALSFVLHPKMKFVFFDPSKIVRTLVVSYDSKYIYNWQINPIKLVSKIPHNIITPDEWQTGWRASLPYEEFRQYLSKEDYHRPIISGALLIPFITLQKAKKAKSNPYTTRESFLATIIHEFGHIFFRNYGKKGELFAFCTEYYASQLFWPKHKEALDNFIKSTEESFIKKLSQNDPHVYALLNAKTVLSRHKHSWPKILSQGRREKTVSVIN